MQGMVILASTPQTDQLRRCFPGNSNVVATLVREEAGKVEIALPLALKVQGKLPRGVRLLRTVPDGNSDTAQERIHIELSIQHIVRQV